MLVLACLVSVGVLYNNARILIAERSAELASLRIQGFTVAEITKLVLGEQGVITVVALPLGLVLGTYASYLVTASVEADVIRLPFVISRYTLLVTSAVILIIWLAVAYRIYLMLRSLDLIAVLKERT
ncbi:MAG: FtsX-like permease family protein [Ignavibacteria bacterium]